MSAVWAGLAPARRRASTRLVPTKNQKPTTSCIKELEIELSKGLNKNDESE